MTPAVWLLGRDPECRQVWEEARPVPAAVGGEGAREEAAGPGEEWQQRAATAD